MNALTDWVLSSLAAYGAPILLLLSFAGSLGIPFPNTIVIVAAGAFTHSGLLDWRLAWIACMIGAVIADNGEYLLGHFAQSWLQQHYAGKSIWGQAQTTINRQGGWAIFLTRFWLMPLAPAINVIAGSRYPYWRFLFFDLMGQFLWVLLYGGLGYLFATQWEIVSQAISTVSGVSLVVFFLVLGGVLWRRHRKTRRVNERKDDDKQLPGSYLCL